MHGLQVGVRPPNTQASWPWPRVRPAVLCTHPIYLAKLPKSVGLVDVHGQPACPKVVNERPILGHVGHSPYGYCAFTSLTKPWPIIQSHAAGLGSAVFVVAVVAIVTEYHVGRIIVLPIPCTWTVVLWWCGLSKQGSFTPVKGPPQTKGTTGDPVGCACGLVRWTRQPFIHISNLTKPCSSFVPSFPQLQLSYPDGVPMPKD